VAIDPNLARIDAVVAALGPLAEELCVVGGCAASLLVSDPGASPMRPTEDVDVIVEALYAKYVRFEAELSKRGFVPSKAKGDPICRRRKGSLVLDVMPLDEKVLGFSNRWYRSAFENRRATNTPSGLQVYCVDAPHFLATKLDAFKGRGNGDFVSSPDLEDVVRVVDGRPEIVEEVAGSPADLRRFVGQGIESCLADRFFAEALPTYFDGPGRARILRPRMEALIRLA
jgi:hypothetical protein